jgi:predicted MPP superfamily phosphohydrolase
MMSLLWLALFAYAGRPLLAGAAAAGIAPVAGWVFLLALAAIPAFSMFTRKAQLTGYAILGIFSTLLVLVFLGDLVRGISLLARFPFNARAVSLSILYATGALSVIGVVQARWPRVRRVAVTIDDLPSELEGYRIVQWSDVHIGPTIQRGFVQSLVDRTNALNADAVAITGDFVDSALEQSREHIEPLRGLRTRDGAFYVTGNHEYYWRASEWIPALQAAGLDFLKNEHRVITRGSAKLVMAGVTDPVGRYTHKQDPDRALSGAPAEAVKVLLSHRPQTANAADRLGVHLQLSGHTHGGQFFPFNLIIKRFQPIVAGLHRVGRTWLYVNRGTGYWGPPTRLAVGGEITVLELRGA